MRISNLKIEYLKCILASVYIIKPKNVNNRNYYG